MALQSKTKKYPEDELTRLLKDYWLVNAAS